MPSTKTTQQLVAEAATLASSYEWVLYNDVLYQPADFETGDTELLPPSERKCWLPMSQRDITLHGRNRFDTIFTQRSLTDFTFFLKQEARLVSEKDHRLLIKTSSGLKVLNKDGKLLEPDGTFVPNMLTPVLNENEDDKAEMMAVITGWLGGFEDESQSLIHHLATALAPHWSAGRYILLIGDGRNGKSVLMSMLKDLFGTHNCSSVERQAIADGSTGVFDLQNKLLNLVFDGPAEFLKDSGREKSIITGEPIAIRKLYANEMTQVQTNALFIEGLNQEPKSRDKSSALQARLVRFRFPNRYPNDHLFEIKMRSERMLGALLSILLENYVDQVDATAKLTPTASSRLLQMDHMVTNSMAMQYLEHLQETDPIGAESALIGADFDDVVRDFQQWRVSINDPNAYDKPTIQLMFQPVVDTARKSRRTNNKISKVRIITGLKLEAVQYLEYLSEDEEEADATTVVDD